MFQRETFTFFYIKYKFYILINIIMKKSICYFEIWISLVFVFFVVFVISSCVMIVINQEKQYENFEKETWLKLEQLTEKYHVHKDQILEKYNEVKYSQQNLESEISNALNKTK